MPARLRLSRPMRKDPQYSEAEAVRYSEAEAVLSLFHRWHAAPVLSVCPKVPTLSRSRRLGQSPGVPAALLKSETADRLDDCDKVRFRPYVSGATHRSVCTL